MVSKMDNTAMQKNIKGLIRNGFFLSILLHLFILLSITTVILVKPEQQKKPPHLYIPSYVYKGSMSSFKSPQKKQTPQYKQQAKQQKQLIDQKETDTQAKLAVNKKQQTKESSPHSQPGHFSMWQASLASLQQEQINSMRQARDNEKPVLLVGDLNQVADPIIKLMAQSLSAHFNYPETEGRLGIRGRVIIELVLHPEGHFTNINILKSSENHNFDAAALYAANTAPLVEGANRFLSKPTRFVIGFVFN